MTKIRHALAPLLTVGVVLAFAATPAIAARGHIPNGHFAGKGPGAGQLEEPSGVAVNEATGDVYVVDHKLNRVEYFSKEGVYQGEFSEGPSASGSGVTNEPTAIGEGTFTPGSYEVTHVVTTSTGKFELGQVISGDGLRPGTTIAGVREETPTEAALTLSSNQSGAPGRFALSTGGNVITDVIGAFVAGEEITGEGIPAATTITYVFGGGVLELSNPLEAGRTGMFVALTAHESLAGPEGIAVDNDPSSPSHGDVYVADVGNGVVDKFTAAGTYINQLTGFSGEQALEGIGVDPEGRLWAAIHNGTVFDFSNAEANAPLGSVPAKLGGDATYLVPGFAVDAHDDLYTRDEAGVVAKFSAAGVVLNAAFDTEPVSGMATELGSEDVYADDIGSLARLSPEGIQGGVVERLTLAGGDGSGVAVNSAEHELYVAQAGAGDVEIFTQEPAGPPTVESEGVSKVTGDSARLEGEVNPRSLEKEPSTEYYFEYGACASLSACASERRLCEAIAGRSRTPSARASSSLRVRCS